MFVSTRIYFGIVVVAVAGLFCSENTERFAKALAVITDTEAVAVAVAVERSAVRRVFAFVDFTVTVVVNIVADLFCIGVNFRIVVVAVAAFECAEIAFRYAQAAVFACSETVIVKIFVVFVAVFGIFRINDSVAVVVNSVAELFSFRINVAVRVVAVASFAGITCRNFIRTVVVENDFFAAEAVAVTVSKQNTVCRNRRKCA